MVTHSFSSSVFSTFLPYQVPSAGVPFMIEFWRRRRLRKAFNSYVQQLGPSLVRRYGPQDQFTVLQGQATVRDLKLDQRFLAYAVALYRHEVSEHTINVLKVDQAFLDALRREVADSLFAGDVTYSAQAVLGLSKRAGWLGGPAPDWIENQRGRTSL